MTPWLLGLALLGCNGDEPSDRPPAPETGDSGVVACDDLSWDNTGQPFVSTWCTACHSSQLAEGERFGAPVGLDLDTYAGVLAHASLVESSALGDEARMPPVGGGTADEKARFGEWLACGLPGAPDDGDLPCADAVVASWGSSTCADGAPVVIEGDVVASGDDGSCVCEVTGSLTVSGGDGDWGRLELLGGDLRVDGGPLSAPALRAAGAVEVVSAGGGAVDLSRLLEADEVRVDGSDVVSLDLHDLRTVPGDVSVSGNPALAYLDLSRLETVGGSVVIEDNDAVPAVLGGLYGLRSVGGDLLLVGNANWLGLYACGQLETVGGDLRVSDNPRFVALDGFTALTQVGGTVSIVSNGGLGGLDGFDQLTDVGGDLIVSGNPVLVREDAFALLERVEGQVVLSGNPGLEEISGLGGMSDVGGIVVNDMRGLTSLGGFPNLTRLRGGLTVQGTGVGGVDGFDGIEQIDGSLVFESNSSLQAIVGFDGLRSVGGAVELRNHNQLSNASGLLGITSVGSDLELVDNPQLSEGGLQGWLDAVEVSGVVELSGNAP